MRPDSLLWTSAATIPLVLASLVVSSNNGRLPGSTLARTMPSCGSCHASAPGGSGIAVNVAPTARSLTPGQAISINTFMTGGAVNSKNWGGMTTYVTGGTFTAGANTRTGSSGVDLTHSTQINNRNWTYGYTAPTTAGLVQMFVVGLTADGNGGDNSADLWSFHNADATATTSTPLRLYVNAIGVTPIGSACAGSYGQVPVLGAKEVPSVGNANFAIEVHGAAPSSPTLMLLGANAAWQPLDLGFIGVTGCKLLVDPLVTMAGMTGAGDAKRAEGVWTQPLAIPNDPGLVGGAFQIQVAIVDASNGRPTPLTLTNAIGIKVQ